MNHDEGTTLPDGMARMYGDHGRCPECGEAWKTPTILRRCTCPSAICIPSGRHIHVDCPRHGKVTIHGPSVVW